MSRAAGTLRIATRGSELARWQANHVAGLLRGARPDTDVELVVVSTEGDRRQDVPLSEIGGKGTFVREVQLAVLDGRADIAVHSAKDIPAVETPGLLIGAFAKRADVRDALVGCPRSGLRAGSRIGTGSQRRAVQLRELVDGIEIAELRGNIATRLGRVGELDAVVVAMAALERLGLTAEVSHVFEPDEMLPQVGQGALAVECRADDPAVGQWLEVLDHSPTRVCVEAERAVLAELGGDCTLPAGAYARLTPAGLVELDALLAGPGGVVHRRHGVAVDGRGLGRELARSLVQAIEGSGPVP